MAEAKQPAWSKKCRKQGKRSFTSAATHAGSREEPRGERRRRDRRRVYAQADDGEGGAVAGDAAPGAVVAAAVPVDERVGRVPEPGLDRHQRPPLPVPISTSRRRCGCRHRRKDQHRRCRPPPRPQRGHPASPRKEKEPSEAFALLPAVKATTFAVRQHQPAKPARANATTSSSPQLARAQQVPLHVHVTGRKGGREE